MQRHLTLDENATITLVLRDALFNGGRGVGLSFVSEHDAGIFLVSHWFL